MLLLRIVGFVLLCSGFLTYVTFPRRSTPFPLLTSDAVSQYTLRYRYVTGSGLRPDTRKKPLTRPGGLVCWRKRSRTNRDRFRQPLYGFVPYCASKCVCMLF
ncbi:hypothetical protein FV247_25240 [Escherichia coli]|nr:hypothetical protein FV247_25240 [Escherichia coli]